MQSQTKKVSWYLMFIALAIFLLPLQSAFAQDALPSNEKDTTIVSVEQSVAENIFDNGDQPQQTAEVELTHRIYLPTIHSGENNNEAIVEAATTTLANTWLPHQCSNVLPGEYDLWDDMPSAGVTNESGLFWLLANQTVAESCSYSVFGIGGVSTTLYPKLQIRAAVNDGAKLAVSLGHNDPNLGCKIFFHYETTTAQARSGFLTHTMTLPTGRSICEVKITLTDDPASAVNSRVSALIDDIRIYSALGTNIIGWGETFTNRENCNQGCMAP